MLGTSVLDNLERDVYIATSASNGVMGGQIITWVTHASLTQEKRNVVCVFSKFNHTYKTLKSIGKFALNLPAQNQVQDAALFGLKSGNDEDKFKDNNNFDIVDGIPVLKNSTGYSILSVMSEVDLGDRIVIIGRVEKEVFNKGITPLKLRYFLKNLTPEQIEKQKENYIYMVERDLPLIKDEI